MDEMLIARAKEFIQKSRGAGVPDQEIMSSLKNAGWPDPIISAGFEGLTESSPSAPALADMGKPTKNTPRNNPDNQNLNVKDEPAVKTDSQNNYQKPGTKGRKFCFMAFIALLLSPVPFIGMGFAMTSLDMINKRNMSGTFIAIIALIINIASILFVLYLIYMIFTLDPGQLTGFSRYINDMFQLV